MFTQLQRTLTFTCSVLVLTQEKSFLQVLHSFFHFSIQLMSIRCLLSTYYVQNTVLDVRAFFLKPRSDLITVSLLSMTSHCQVQTPGHIHHVLAHLHASVHAVSLSGLSLLMVQSL